MKILILLIVMANIALAQHPQVEDFVLKGYETSNFKNVLLDPNSPISDFYLITDDGKVLKVKDMGLDPKVQNVYTYDGQITEAISNEDTHYLSLAGETETMLIATKNFIDIDTIYSESNAQITDFRIENNSIYILSNNGSEGKIHYSAIGTKNWNEKNIPDVTYNRIFVMDTLVALFKYMNKDVTLSYINDFNQDWDTTQFIPDFYSGLVDLKPILGSIAFIGDQKIESNRVYFSNKNFEYLHVEKSAAYNNIINDISFENSFNFNSNILHIGNYKSDCECGYLYRFTYNGDTEKNIFYFPNSKSLNKIKSNKKANNVEFVSVGDDGIVLLINRNQTGIELEKDYNMEKNNFKYYPNPIKEGIELRIESEEMIKSISITDIAGKKGLHYMMIDKYEYNLPISGFAKGVYFLTVNGKTRQFIIE